MVGGRAWGGPSPRPRSPGGEDFTPGEGARDPVRVVPGPPLLDRKGTGIETEIETGIETGTGTVIGTGTGTEIGNETDHMGRWATARALAQVLALRLLGNGTET